MNITMSMIKADIIAAKQAVEYYNQNKIKDIKNVAAYHLQQATEKLIKIQIYANAKKIDNSGIYTHNIEKLLTYTQSLKIDISVPKYIEENSLIITEWEAGSRYNVGFQIRIDSLEKALSEIGKWYDSLYESGLRQA